MRVATVRISTIAHATEDIEKVLNALELLANQEVVRSKMQKTRVKGHYGNEITTITFKITGRLGTLFFHRLWTRLPRNETASVTHDVGSRLDENGRFHLRLDKQLAFLDTLRLGDRDPIKIEVSFKGEPKLGSETGDGIRKMIESESLAVEAE